ncbi:hypothetical protein ACIP10_33035 [Streptomyces galbus]|uniref:hypothetical protein n=1 Tax=Streptomyces galbus TaxID=33898 RepID=UPI00379A9EAF
MNAELASSLAYGHRDDPSDWAWIAAIFVLYLLIGYALEYRSKKRRGIARPAKAAARGLFSERRSNAPLQHFTSRMVMLCGALVTGFAGYFTRNAPVAVQFPTVGVVALLCIFAWAYFDYRTEPRDGSSS